MKTYHIKSSARLVRDEASTKFHIANDDYFGTIAAVLSLIEQQLDQRQPADIATFQKTLRNIKQDLVWLQQNYQINPKTKKSRRIPKGKLKSQ